MSKVNFTKQQILAIDETSNMVITACPGSGKTTVIVEKIRNEVAELPSFMGVIGITFTKKASSELKLRCKKGNYDTGASFFGTIDNFCLSEIIFPFISRVYPYSGKELECKDFPELPDYIVGNLKNTYNITSSSSIDLLDINVIGYLYSEGVILLQTLCFTSIYILKNSNSCRKYIKSKYNSIYIDEYQDSSKEQHELFLLIESMGLKSVAVGDIQQSIYAWRGSKTTYIKELISKKEKFKHYEINFNHRCHPSITNYANRLFDANCNLLDTDKIRVYHTSVNGNQNQIADYINNLIPKVLNSKKNMIKNYSDFAILVRNNNTLTYLRNNINVPFIIYSDDPLSNKNTFATKVMSILLKLRYSNKILISDVLDVLSKNIKISEHEKKTFRDIIKSVKSHDEITIKDKIIESTSIMIKDYITESEINALNNVLISPNLLQLFKPSSDEVQIMTLHKSKGLEFKFVFHLDLYDWILPSREFTPGNYEPVFHDLEQDLNLHYVGITRAEEYCILLTSTDRFNSADEIKKGNPSQFLSYDGIENLFNTI